MVNVLILKLNVIFHTEQTHSTLCQKIIPLPPLVRAWTVVNILHHKNTVTVSRTVLTQSLFSLSSSSHQCDLFGGVGVSTHKVLMQYDRVGFTSKKLMLTMVISTLCQYKVLLALHCCTKTIEFQFNFR